MASEQRPFFEYPALLYLLVPYWAFIAMVSTSTYKYCYIISLLHQLRLTVMLKLNKKKHVLQRPVQAVSPYSSEYKPSTLISHLSVPSDSPSSN